MHLLSNRDNRCTSCVIVGSAVMQISIWRHPVTPGYFFFFWCQQPLLFFERLSVFSSRDRNALEFEWDCVCVCVCASLWLKGSRLFIVVLKTGGWVISVQCVCSLSLSLSASLFLLLPSALLPLFGPTYFMSAYNLRTHPPPPSFFPQWGESEPHKR